MIRRFDEINARKLDFGICAIEKLWNCGDETFSGLPIRANQRVRREKILTKSIHRSHIKVEPKLTIEKSFI